MSTTASPSTSPPNSVSISSSASTASSTSDGIPQVSSHDLPSAVAFLIGLLIILFASLMNAGGLNLVKLDFLRNSELPKSQRRRDWLRPLWVIGMTLYIISQLVGSTLALEFLRAEYVAPLGSSSLVFNFLFARWLLGTQVTRNDIYGTITVIIGVCGIVAFGSINHGLSTHMDITLLSTLWSRAGWLAYFVLFGFLPLLLLYLGAGQLESVLQDRTEEILDEPSSPKLGLGTGLRERGADKPSLWKTVKARWGGMMHLTKDLIERWSRDKSDKTLAWTLGICWACCGGALAGGCLVFAKASVKLISGTLSHQNQGNQFVHPAAIFTFIFLALTAVLQILCLNKGLRVYDSTLVVPVFYGVYTASGFLDSLVFNDEVDAYETWTLFLIFTSIVVLISGVVLLTLKKPEPKKGANGSNANSSSSRSRFGLGRLGKGKERASGEREDDEISLTERGELPLDHDEPSPDDHVHKGEDWDIGEDSEDEIDKLASAPPMKTETGSSRRGIGLMNDEDDFGDFAEAKAGGSRRRSSSKGTTDK